MKSIFTIILLLISTLGLISEEEENNHKVFIGTNFGMNLNGSDFKNIGQSNTCCEGFTSGFGTGLNFAAGYGFQVDNNMWLTLGFSYNNLSSDFIELQNESINLTGNAKVNSEIEQKVNSKLSSLGITIGTLYELSNHFDATLGYRISIPSEINYRQTEILVNPKNALFRETDSRIRTDESGSLSSNLFHSLVAGIGYKLLTTSESNSYLRPNIGFTLGLTDANDEMNLNSNTISFGLDFAYNFDLTSNKEIDFQDNKVRNAGLYTQDTTADIASNNIESNTTNNTKIVIRPVSIEKSGNRQDINNIELEQVKSIRMIPLLNYIFFEKDSSNFPIRYSLLKKEDRLTFEIDNLFEENTIDIYHHILNIIGKRMSENPKLDLKIVGTKSDIETGDLSKILPIERAKTVRDYLAKTWGIGIPRLNLESIDSPYIPSSSKEEESIQENQRVELYSNTQELLAPLLLRDTLYTPLTKEVTFFMVVDTNLKSYSWKFEVFDSKNKLLFESDGREAPPLITTLSITEELAAKIKDMRELVYRFELIKDNQERESITGRINVTVNSLEEKERKKLRDRRIDKYSLILFDFDKFELNKKNLEILEIVKKNIQSDSQLLISGYSDKIGSEEYNKELSKKRTESVANQFINIAHKEEFPYGESIILYNNNIPEGRFYSRTVQIKAITPVR